jgi:formate-dependent nitrite reductase membrane component NrfD
MAVSLSGAALVHDLGRPARFLNMLRVLKPSSPMSIGSWLLAAYAPMSAAASLNAVTGRLRPIGTLGTAGAAALGPAVATYTAALISDTAVPAWHEGYRQMPFLFAASAASAAAGLGMAVAPRRETAPVRHLGIGAAAAELALMQLMKKAMGEAGEAFSESQKGHRYEQKATAVTTAGIAVAALAGRRSRPASALAGTAILAGSAFTRFAIFEAGLTSAENPRYTIVPQRRRVLKRQARDSGG